MMALLASRMDFAPAWTDEPAPVYGATVGIGVNT